jgi:hypothetical protein
MNDPIRHFVVCKKNFVWMDMFWVVPRRVGITLADGLCNLGVGGHFGWRLPWLGVVGHAYFSFIPWHLPCNWGKAHTTLMRLIKYVCCAFYHPWETRIVLVSIVSDYRLDDWGSIPEEFSSSLCPDQLWGPPSLLTDRYQEWGAAEAWSWPPAPSAEVKNE